MIYPRTFDYSNDKPFIHFGIREGDSEGSSWIWINSWTTIWEIGGSPETGLLVTYDVADAPCYTAYRYKNGKWEMTTPPRTDLLSFEDAINLWARYLPNRPTIYPFTFRYDDYSTFDTYVTTLPLGFPEHADKGVVLKFKDYSAEDFKIPDLSLPDVQISIAKDYWGKNDDAIVIKNKQTNEVKYYKVISDSAMGMIFNGTDFITDRYIYNELSESYEQSMSNYYSTPAMRKLLNTPPETPDNDKDPRAFLWTINQVSITDKFDGVNEERLTVFPIESSVSEYGPLYYSKFVVKSEKGTVPNLIFYNDSQRKDDMHAYEFEFGKYEHSENAYSGVTISPWRTIWEVGKSPELGLIIAGHPEGSTIMDYKAYIYRDGEWQMTTPPNTSFLPFDECFKAWAQFDYTPITGSFSYNNDIYGGITKTKFALFPLGIVGNKGKGVVIKFKNSIDDFALPDFTLNQIKVSVYPGCWGDWEDAIVITDKRNNRTHYYRAFENPDGNGTFNNITLNGEGYLMEVDANGEPIQNEEFP